MWKKLIKNKIPISILTIIALIVIWFLISLTNNSIVGDHIFPQVADDFSGQIICSNKNTGWSCELNNSNLDAVETYKNKCEEMGGRWNCHGLAMIFMSEYNYNCDCGFKYKDGGDLCISSLQCGGRCIGLFGMGKCSEYPISFCDSYKEIFFGVPISHRILCD